MKKERFTVSSCKESAIHSLSRRDHGRHELTQKLLLKGYPEHEVSEAILYCEHLGYLDDRRYAQSMVRQHVNKLHGRLRIAQELKQKRVENEIIDASLEECEVDWFELAKKAAERKFNLESTIDQKEKAKRIRFLQYRGFSFEQIQYALSNGPE